MTNLELWDSARDRLEGITDNASLVEFCMDSGWDSCKGHAKWLLEADIVDIIDWATSCDCDQEIETMCLVCGSTDLYTEEIGDDREHNVCITCGAISRHNCK